MSLQNNSETSFALMGAEDWEKALRFSESASQIASPHETNILRLRAIKTIGKKRGLQTPVDNDSRFSVFSSREEIQQELNNSLKSLGLQMLLYEAMTALGKNNKEVEG